MAASNDAPYVISRQDARASGQAWYFEKPCLHGHLAKRLVAGRQCLECHRLGRARLRAEDPERIKRQKAASYLRHRDEVIAHVSEYTAANPEKVRERRRKHRAANKEQIAERMKEWSKANRPLLRQHERNRRAREAGAEGKHTAAEVNDLLKKQRFRCAAPGCKESLRTAFHVDHVKPLALGGTNWISNIQLLCPFHNQSKHARDPIEWAQSLGALL